MHCIFPVQWTFSSPNFNLLCSKQHWSQRCYEIDIFHVYMHLRAKKKNKDSCTQLHRSMRVEYFIIYWSLSVQQKAESLIKEPERFYFLSLLSLFEYVFPAFLCRFAAFMLLNVTKTTWIIKTKPFANSSWSLYNSIFVRPKCHLLI